MLDKVFLQVINMTYISSIVILFILAARLLLKKAPKKYSYILWAIALFRLIIPISFESTLSLIPVNPRPVSPDLLYNTAPQINTGISNIDQLIAKSIPEADVAASVNPMQVWVFIGSLIWIAGLALLLIYGISSFIKTKRKLEDASYYKDNIYKANNIDSPFVLGLIKPKIYLPMSLSESEKEYIVLHEKTHIKRYDHVIRFISYLVLCIHWFNPLVWIAFWISGEDMEMSCDEAVISQLGKNVKKDYSQSLLNLTRGKKSLSMTPLAFGEGETKGRIKNIINFKEPKFYITIIALIILGLAFIGLMTNPKKDPEDFAEGFPEMFTSKDGIWVNTGEEIIAEIDEDKIMGEIRSEDIFDMTGEYDTENSKIVGSSYAYYEEDIVVRIEDKWILFSTIEEWAKAKNIELGGGMSIGYSDSDKEAIFGDLKEEEINKIMEEIMDEVAENEDYEKNKDSIIGKVFKENGITDPDKIDAAKGKLIISK